MRVLITGGAGFIGANLARAMLAHEFDVVVLDDLSTGSADNLHGLDVELHVASILDEAAVARALHDVESVVHLAAIPSVPRSLVSPMASHEANATGTLIILEALRRAGGIHCVLASSSSVYGANPQMPKHEAMPTAPLSPYAVSKLATEAYAIAYHHSFGLDVLPLRFFNVFGPLQPAGHAYAAVIPAFIEAAVARRPLPVHGDGSQTRDFTFVETVTNGIVQAVLGRVTSAEPVNLAFGTQTSLNQLITLLGETLGRALHTEFLPRRPGDVPHSRADGSRLARLLPDLRPVPLEEGLRKTVAWFMELDRSGSTYRS